jgi:transposase-like protein
MTKRAQQDITRELKVLNHARETGNVSKTCRYFGICRETFSSWRRAYETHGENALIDSRPCPENHKLMMAAFNEQKPLIQLNDMSSVSKMDEQLGFKFLFTGGISGIRNPRGHEYELKDDIETCLSHLGFGSMLLVKLEEAGYCLT